KTAKIEGLNEFYATQDGFFRLLAALIRQSLSNAQAIDHGRPKRYTGDQHQMGNTAKGKRPGRH
ncbi:hypothetical protein, partial [Xanthomonas cucurbitae]|uniref:hypothetical protein n=1 Tax=Xanthomonas cucurbitae TaxID=56453 RepID=UPI001B80B8F5